MVILAEEPLFVTGGSTFHPKMVSIMQKRLISNSSSRSCHVNITVDPGVPLAASESSESSVTATNAQRQRARTATVESNLLRCMAITPHR